MQIKWWAYGLAAVLASGSLSAVSAAEPLNPGTIRIEQSFSNDGVKLDVSITQTTDPLELGSILYKVHTTVTNTGNKPVSYIINGCDTGIVSEITTGQGEVLEIRNPAGCTDVFAVDELKAGASINREEVFVAPLAPANMLPDAYELKSSFMRGSFTEKQYLEMHVPFEAGPRLPERIIDLDVQLSRADGKYNLTATGSVLHDDVAKVSLSLGKKTYRVGLQEKKLKLNKRISWKGAVPETGLLKVSYKDGRIYTLPIPLQLTPAK